MNKDQRYAKLLVQLLKEYKTENRFLEFKSNYQDVTALGRYISALSNGACLENQEYGYLFFGVDDKTHEIKHTTFDITQAKAVGAENLELYLRRMITPKINFYVDEFWFEAKRLVVFVIPAAVNEPTTYMQKAYVRVNSQTTELTPYVEWVRTIYNSQCDWTKAIIPNATI